MLSDEDRKEIGIYESSSWTPKKIFKRELGMFLGTLIAACLFLLLAYYWWDQKFIPGRRGSSPTYYTSEPGKFYLYLVLPIITGFYLIVYSLVKFVINVKMHCRPNR